MKKDHAAVLLTRFRWDCYLIPVLLAAIVIGWCSGQFGSAFQLLALWGWLRFSTPAKGMPTSTIRATPGLESLLWNFAVVIGSLFALMIFDMTVLGARFNAPLKPYHLLLFSPSLILFMVGAIRAEMSHRVRKRERAGQLPVGH